MRRVFALSVSSLIALVVASIVGSAAADALDDMHVLVGLERTTGVAFTRIETTSSGKTSTESYTGGSLLWTLNGASPQSLPRFAFDGIVAGHLTLGGSVGYGAFSGTRDEASGASTDLGTTKAFVVAPRLGVLYPIAPSVYFWPRIGVTYFTMSTERSSPTPPVLTVKTTIDGTSIDLEPAIAIFPAPRFGVLLQALVALPVGGTESQQATSGSVSSSSPDADSRWRSIGAFVGVVAAF